MQCPIKIMAILCGLALGASTALSVSLIIHDLTKSRAVSVCESAYRDLNEDVVLRELSNAIKS